MSGDIDVIRPEVYLAIYCLLALLGAAFTIRDRATPILIWLTAIVLALMAWWIGAKDGLDLAFAGSFVDDGFARFAKVTILLSAAVVLLLSEDYLRRANVLRFEYPILVALSVLGMMVMVSAGDLIVLYMGLELQALAAYVLTSIRRDSVRSTEAGLKFFVLGALSSGLLLYGASLTYGYAGTTAFAGIIAGTADGVSLGLLFGLVFICAGIAFKVSAAPFHMWTPDVYEGSPTPITAFLATASKVAATGLLARIVFGAFGMVAGDWQQIVAFLSVVSMYLGSIAAIGQRDIKRLMAYSSISHMGFALMGLASATEFGVQAMLIYMAIYVVMNLGTFAFILSMEKNGQPITDIRMLNMFSRTEPAKALALLVLLFSLAGVPPMVGFFGKLYVLRAAYEGDLTWLAILGMIASVISAFFYLRIVYFMYFGEERQPIDGRMSGINWAILMGSAAIMILGVVNLFGIEGVAAAAAATLVQ
ncbi:NADH-ubiquinone oxidoreductase chain N [Rubellimicrobium mesophilum DSM 19309]|uniref:NADH-quinone oxidoreductase subunit N n=1 Tax=Rubellimicrobium mesophilum DSM 19309 TaxID=442562 RepID=A0A017HTR7_9RHOB|nr:NADH-quinone oxidoreductase subunit NuoN [Rubellimicrobium mesophilum]EYD77791.1 NADH-ubiquinone oxidoreductase chain N [Rubellimicrobium mesophilum DSM 19309]